MHKQTPVIIRLFLNAFSGAALLLAGSGSTWADNTRATDQARLSISLTISRPVRMHVQPDVVCLHNAASHGFSLRQTQGARAFAHELSLPSSYQTLKSDQCKKGQALQFSAEPAPDQEYALLHVLVEPD